MAKNENVPYAASVRQTKKKKNPSPRGGWI